MSGQQKTVDKKNGFYGLFFRPHAQNSIPEDFLKTMT